MDLSCCACARAGALYRATAHHAVLLFFLGVGVYLATLFSATGGNFNAIQICQSWAGDFGVAIRNR